MDKIKIAIVGVGNCASSLIQGIYYYRNKDARDSIGLMHWDIGGYRPGDIEVVAAFDVDKRKVGKDVSEAIFAPPTARRYSVMIYPGWVLRYPWGTSLMVWRPT